MDIIVDTLKSALASEYQAYHMYRSAYYRIRGYRRGIVVDELLKHSQEELEHADMLEKRISELGGYSFSDPSEWNVWNADRSFPILSSDDVSILNTIKDSEDYAVSLYKEIYNKCEGDIVTQDIITDILRTEEEHLFDVKYNMIGTAE